MTRQTEHTSLRRRLRPAGWAAAYLAAAAALIAVAGAELSGTSPAERARKVEARAGERLALLARAASRRTDSWAVERRRREAERRAILESAHAVAVAWASVKSGAFNGRRRDLPPGLMSGTGGAGRKLPGPLETGPLMSVPDGVALAVIGPDGTPVFEAGGSVEPGSPGAILEPIPGGFTVAAAWAEELPDPKIAASRALREEIAPGLDHGTGLYLVAPDGTLAAEVAPRPVPAAPLVKSPVSTGPVHYKAGPNSPARYRRRPLETPLVTEAPLLTSGDIETGRLLSARSLSRELGWTAVAERFLSPEELTAGSRGWLGMIALTGLGLVAAAAFAHTVGAGFGRRERALRPSSSGRPSGPRTPTVRSATSPAQPPRAKRGAVSCPGAEPRGGQAGSLESGFATEGTRTGAAAGSLPPRAPGARSAVAPRPARPRPASTAPEEGPPEPVPDGRSIIRLREALGASGGGPDLAACARSSILRALSRHVGAKAGAVLPREARDWGLGVVHKRR